jgi:hypothetical protein
MLSPTLHNAARSRSHRRRSRIVKIVFHVPDYVLVISRPALLVSFEIWAPRIRRAERLKGLTHEAVLRTQVLVGSPDSFTEGGVACRRNSH